MGTVSKPKIAHTGEPAQSAQPRDFRKQARTQAQAVAASSHTADDQAFIDAVSVNDFAQADGLLHKPIK